jgi:mono/diheme cytochrome c family protein
MYLPPRIITSFSLAALLVPALLLTGCDNMDKQHKAKAWSSESHAVQAASGTVQWREKPAPPPPLTLALLQRGQQRFRIYCTPCHSELGDGNGMVVQRGFPHPPSYDEQRLVQAPTQHFYDVITHGHGAMYSFAARVAPQDRWAIAAYIRALQLSQHASPDDLSPAQRQALK